MIPESKAVELKDVTVCAKPSLLIQWMVAPGVALTVPGEKLESRIVTVQDVTHTIVPPGCL